MISLQVVVLRLVCALFLGAFVGLEREKGERAAGLRTYALVALGSCLIMIISAFGFGDIMHENNIALDPSRVAAQIVSGIGFLGGGAILLRKDVVTGLTTAAAIWVVAGIGMACGAGLLLEAAIATAMTIVVLALFQPLRRFIHRSPEVHPLRIKVMASEDVDLSRAYDLCVDAGAVVDTVEVQTGNGKEKLEITCTASDLLRLSGALVTLRALPGIEMLSVHLRNTKRASLPFLFVAASQADENLLPEVVDVAKQ